MVIAKYELKRLYRYGVQQPERPIDGNGVMSSYLIIGQGLAGTLTGHRLERAGHRVDYYDPPDQVAASQVAAGIVNPITGRRFVKSWRIDELLPAAKALYTDLEKSLGIKIWYDLALVRTLFNRGDQNDWLARSGDPGYADYMDDQPPLANLAALTQPAFAYAGVRRTARVDVRRLVATKRKQLIEEDRITQQRLDYTSLPKGYEAIICCEGWRARFNPWFSYLPHGGNKGEVLIIRTEQPPLRLMYKHRIFLVPQDDGTYWVGATSDNTLDDPDPTAANRDYLRTRLSEVLTVPYEVVDHRAAVRPTVRDRRMIIGPHPERSDLYIFNGLGTKGASLAPLGSKWLFDLLTDGVAVPGEVSIARFAA